MSRTSASTPDEAPAWLHEQVYAPRRQRTLDLTRCSVDALRRCGQTVSLASVVARSKEIDPAGRGVCETAILNNAEANAYYRQHRTWTGGRTRHRGQAPRPPQEIHIKADRDLTRVRQRYMRLSKPELVERLLAVEQAYAEHQELWLQANDDLLAAHLKHHDNTRPTTGLTTTMP